MKTLKQQIRIVGILYFMIVLLGIFIIMYIPSQIIVEGNALETVQNLLDNELLFRIGIIGEVVILMIEIMIVTLLYSILKRVDKTLAVSAAFARFGMVVIMGVNVLIYAAILPIITNPGYFSSFTSEQLDSIIYLLFNIHEYGVYVWGVFFSAHLAILGYLIVKSDFMPSIIGKAIMIGSAGYLFESIRAFSNIENLIFVWTVNILLVFSMVGEISLFMWFLLNKKIEKYEKEFL